MDHSSAATPFLPSEVLTDVLAFLPYKNAREFLYVSGRCSQILVKQINHQLRPMLDTCAALKESCSQLDTQINVLSVQLQLLNEQVSLVMTQFGNEIDRYKQSQSIFFVIFYRQRYLAEIDAIWNRFEHQVDQIDDVSSPIEDQIVQLEAEKVKLNEEINKLEYFIRHGEFQPDPIPVSTITENIFQFANNVIALLKLAFLYDVHPLLSNCKKHLQNCYEIPLIDRMLLASEYDFEDLQPDLTRCIPDLRLTRSDPAQPTGNRSGSIRIRGWPGVDQAGSVSGMD
uniref:F-box domain-containing protein n=1 Tax=Ditylenchus dipsaci TaxID=166011 RepID=A0A915CPX7_9BILA